MQLGLVGVAYWLAFLIRFDASPPDWATRVMWQTLPAMLVIKAVTFIPFKMYLGLWQYTGLYDLRALAGAALASSLLVTIGLATWWAPRPYPRGVVIIDLLLVVILLGGLRLTYRLLAQWHGVTASRTRVLVYGAGTAGEMILREMRQDPALRYMPVGILDDDPAKVGRYVHGIRVLGGRQEMARIVADLRPHEVLLAAPAASTEDRRLIVEALTHTNVAIKTLPALRDVIEGSIQLSDVRPLRLEDLLARSPVRLDPQPVNRFLHGQHVLVTGAGGSIGAELSRQVLDAHPARLILLDRCENALHAIQLELVDRRRRLGVETQMAAVVADVTDAALVSRVFREHQPHVVFHAAAHKHVGLMQHNPCEAVKNNVRGTRIVVQAAADAGSAKFVMLSTDKAVRPASVMGASKRVAELAVMRLSERLPIDAAIVRFGNVLGSNGSAVPRFMDQIRAGGPVTVTHPDVRRYFMLIPEAVQLVLQAAADTRSRATYVLEMGDPVKITDLARSLIRLSGRVPDHDIKIVFTGLTPGEKVSEELVDAGERLVPSPIPNVHLVDGLPALTPDFDERLEALVSDALAGETLRVLDGLASLTNPPWHPGLPAAE